MRVGVPKEIKVHEYRVGLTPASVAELVAAGHQVVVRTGAGDGIDCPDSAYVKAGAEILPDAASVFKAAASRSRADDTSVPGPTTVTSRPAANSASAEVSTSRVRAIVTWPRSHASRLNIRGDAPALPSGSQTITRE